jgi:hypothetical protein
MKITDANKAMLRELKTSMRIPMNRMVNDILEKFFGGQIKEVTEMKVTEVAVTVSKKICVNFNSCSVSYMAKATLDENEHDHVQALVVLKDELVARVQEAMNGKCNHNNNGNDQRKEEQQ